MFMSMNENHKKMLETRFFVIYLIRARFLVQKLYTCEKTQHTQKMQYIPDYVYELNKTKIH